VIPFSPATTLTLNDVTDAVLMALQRRKAQDSHAAVTSLPLIGSLIASDSRCGDVSLRPQPLDGSSAGITTSAVAHEPQDMFTEPVYRGSIKKPADSRRQRRSRHPDLRVAWGSGA
jgi:hypothetical protein